MLFLPMSWKLMPLGQTFLLSIYYTEIQANFWWINSMWDCLGDIFLERCSKELLQLGSLCPANYRLTVANYAIFTRPRDRFFSSGFSPFSIRCFLFASPQRKFFLIPAKHVSYLRWQFFNFRFGKKVHHILWEALSSQWK